MTHAKALSVRSDRVASRFIAMPKIYSLHHRNAPAGAVFIGRGGKYGNPFVIGPDGTREEVIRKFECFVLPQLDVSSLKGEDLVCFLCQSLVMAI